MVFRFSPDGSQRLKRTMTSTPIANCINEVLPEEVFGVIFEEHAKLDWRAPVIDGRVCRQWSQIILNSPRVWAHLEINLKFATAPSKLLQWLDRSGSVPLHIEVTTLTQTVKEVLGQYSKRIESIALRSYHHDFLENRSFPILQSLTIGDWDHSPGAPVASWSACGSMPVLRSLRASFLSVGTLPPNIFPPLRDLTLYLVKDCDFIIRNSYHSLTSLMLGRISLQYTSESLEFPSLRFLSLFNAKNIKHRVNVPALTTYHESDRMEEEAFSMSLPFLTEYGIFRLSDVPPLNVTKLHGCYPNISRLSVRTPPSVVRSFLHSLSRQPTALPMLRILAVGDVRSLIKYSGEDKDSMRNDVFMRNMVSSVEMELCFDGILRVPLYFANVRVYIDKGQSQLTSSLRTRIISIEDLSFVLSLWLPCCSHR